MNRSARFSLGVFALAIALGATGCKKKKSDDDMPPVNAQQKKSGKGKGDAAKKGPPTVLDFEKAARAEITPENAADKLVALEKEIFLDQEQLKTLPGAKSKDETKGTDAPGSDEKATDPMPAGSASGAKPTAKAPKKAPAPKASAN